jgi:hypothetical protein
VLGQKVLLNQMPIAIKDSKIDISSEKTIDLIFSYENELNNRSVKIDGLN